MALNHCADTPSVRAPESGLGQIVGAVRRRIVPACVVGIVVTVSAWAYMRSLDPEFEAEAILHVQGSSQLGGMLGEAGSLLGMDLPGSSVTTHRALLKTRDLLTSVSAELGRPIVGEEEWLELERRVDASQIAGSDLISVRVRDKDPGLAADFANLLVDRHIERTIKLAEQPPQEMAEYIRRLMAEVEVNVEDAAGNVSLYKTEKGIVDPVSEASSGIGVLAALSTEIAAARAARSGASAQANSFRRLLQEVDESYVASSTIARNPLVISLEADLARLETERAGLVTNYGEDHALVRDVTGRIDEVKQHLSAAVESVVADQVEAVNPQYLETLKLLSLSESEMRAADARIGALEGVLNREREKLRELPTIEKELGALEREARASVEIYRMLLTKYHETKVAEFLNRPALRIVTRAEQPERPLSGPVFMLALAMMLGFLSGCAVVVVAEARDGTFRHAAEAAALLGVPLLGTVPRLRTGEELLAGDGATQSRLADDHRRIRSALAALVGSEDTHCVAFAGIVGGEGCSTAVVNQAAVDLWQGRAPIAVDADSRGPRLHSLLGVEQPEPGLAEALLGAGSPTQALVQTESGILLLPVGEARSVCPDLLASSAWRTVVAGLRERTGPVLVDCPPLASVADAVEVASACDAIVVVIRPGVTPRTAAKEAVDRLRTRGMAVLGLVATADPRAQRVDRRPRAS